ncbi:RNA polymerase beta subunit [Pseudomonas phage Noxifer]|uniref:Putative RNA polymerase beta subunit n=1 Tax=Pseudomonas phage Noxifer TaxID=2006684 RepID=A0A1Y0SXU3_9CAUD|nr:RNA polymerase beta subunit [Pseudomonas phage Noxifer]ARV77365.1 putative RNA polymerase beta subunit [Pseudomonas phage Noxifer]
MKKKMLPLNISLLIPTPESLRLVPQVKSLGIMDGPGGSFDDEGLFSTTIFGRVGDPLRDKTFAHIDLRLPVLHPIIFRVLSKMRSFFIDIMAGKEYATFSQAKGTFERANEVTGRTGYTFFMEYWEQLRFEKGDSSTRNVQIELIERYRGKATFSHLLVLPAGLRDVEVDAAGRVTVGEINDLYQKCLIQGRNFPERITRGDDLSIYDRTRYATQCTVVAIYEYLETLIKGKGGMIQAKWASRKVFNGTRNVISSLDVTAVDLDAPNRPKFNDAVVGLYQAASAVLPKTIYNLRVNLLESIFASSSNSIKLIDKKTLQLKWVDVTNETMDRWSTEEGLEGVVDELSVIEKRHRPVEIEGHYLALVYVDDKGNFKIFRDLDDFPEQLDRKFVRPISYVEMIYLAGLSMWEDTAAFVTRYPVENFNSSSPVMQYVKTTVPGELRYGMGDNWERDESIVAKEYPKLSGDSVPQYHDSTSIPPARLTAKGADFDGDTMSYNATYSDEAVAEAKKYFTKRRAYIQAGGGMSFGIDIHTVNLTLLYITGNPKPRVAHALPTA